MSDVNEADATRGWEPHRGWGWIWGGQDEVGALNALTESTTLAAMQRITQGRTYDLGVLLDRTSFLAPAHVPTGVVAYRTPQGLINQDIGFQKGGVSFNTSMITISDHAGTQLDGLCHATFGDDHHWYNGFTTREWGRDFGPDRAGAHNIPPIIARGVLIDVAAHLGLAELQAGHPISPGELQSALESQGTTIEPGTVVLVRTGAMRHWGDVGADHGSIKGPDTAGLTLAAARWLVEEKGAILVGSDTSTVECVPPFDGDNVSPVHKYLLVDQGVHMGELHYLEDLAASRAYDFCYIALCPKVRATTAGFALRPIAVV